MATEPRGWPRWSGGRPRRGRLRRQQRRQRVGRRVRLFVVGQVQHGHQLGGQPVHPQGRHDRLRQQRAGLHRRLQHRLRVQPELHPAVRDPADHLQIVRGAVRERDRAGLGDHARVASNGNKTWTFHLKSGVKFEDGQPVTSADVKYAVERTFDRSARPTARATSRRCWPGTRRSTRGRSRTRRSDRGHHAERDDDRVQPQPAVRGLQLRGGVPADRPGAAEQVHRRELPAAPAVHRAVQVRASS